MVLTLDIHVDGAFDDLSRDAGDGKGPVPGVNRDRAVYLVFISFLFKYTLQGNNNS